jgi:hypothetical protein
MIEVLVAKHSGAIAGAEHGSLAEGFIADALWNDQEGGVGVCNRQNINTAISMPRKLRDGELKGRQAKAQVPQNS